ncbi:MAG: hemerythrin family protein [SAR324 cluster bacterium]|nr:hemerythrin family protein [SAR324 cluster bacterium]
MLQFKKYLRAQHSVLDKQHEDLFAAIDVFYHDHLLNSDKSQLNKIFKQISFYTKDHFSLEEEIMARASFPSREAHQALHQEIFDQLQSFHKKFTTEDKKTLGTDMMNFFRNKIIPHVEVDDLEFVAFLKQDAKEQAEENYPEFKGLQDTVDCESYRTSPLCVYNHLYEKDSHEINFEKLQSLCSHCKGDFNYRALIVGFITNCTQSGKLCWLKSEKVNMEDCTTESLEGILDHCCTCASAQIS